ncbi:Lrp/AsnC family transcriptional regulator [Arthrobacter sp. SDTb3-6]|uniref:Lrp/AsnC family transcriptional regulator n=1 Tax=Arthrobacter sp. SDTb3-6 TaxID=2713571 RepID=UPI00159E15A1|nr:Lrp/AsnC family transcriptional regulator [Arthrobacter sp. SDTb3-6]NVM98551.1 Lrp/AsnC family transcriptional regulator [Arthrobacter sp. SDTb3-6]
MELDELDRQITAALLRNGRAPWRLIADVLGQQERTVARRGNRLLASGNVRVQSFPNPLALDNVDLYMLRVRVEPAALRSIGAWLAGRPDTHWVSGLAGSSECIVEMFARPGDLGQILYGEVAARDGVRDFSLEPVLEYHRTVSGWAPDLLTVDQYDALYAAEQPQLITRFAATDRARIDDTNRAIIDLLRANGRSTNEELATALSISKATAGRRVEALIASGAVTIRAVLDAAMLGYPVEALLEMACTAAQLPAVGRHVAGHPTTRWAASVGDRLLVQTAVPTLGHLKDVIAEFGALDGVQRFTSSLYVDIFKRSTVVYIGGQLPPVAV